MITIMIALMKAAGWASMGVALGGRNSTCSPRPSLK